MIPEELRARRLSAVAGLVAITIVAIAGTAWAYTFSGWWLFVALAAALSLALVGLRLSYLAKSVSAEEQDIPPRV